MAEPAPRLHDSPSLQEALAWLGAPPADDPLHDLAPMRSHLAAIADIGISPLQHVKILELFEVRAKLTSDALKPLLLDATLPVPKRLRVVGHGLMQVHRSIASGYLKALREATPEKLQGSARSPSQVCAAGLANLQREYEIARFVSAPAPADFWAQAEAFYRVALAQSDPADEVAPALNRMKALLALAAGQPEGFSPREVAFLAAYLQQHAAAVDILDADAAGDDHYWLDAVHGFAPVASVRRRATVPAALHFGCAGVGRTAREQLARLESGEPPTSVGLPPDAASADYRDVLARAAAHWENPRTRRTNRRRHGYRVQVCTQLGRLWQHSGHEHALTEIELAQSEWMILNESASGYAIMHVAGELGGLTAGSAIGLRPASDKPWNICLVRWARSDNPEHIELGLELVAPQAEAVRIARPSASGASQPLPALLLPPLAAIKRGEALLTARGCFTPGAFTLINESSGRIQVAECTASHLQMHTACIEIFEFERQRIPC